jgi:type IV secretory pathway VirD2 relaxase
MTSEDDTAFRLRPGRIANRGGGSARRVPSFVQQVMRATAKAGGSPATIGIGRTGGRKRSGGKVTGKGKCSRIGRGQAVADRLKRQVAEGRGPRSRRVVVKARIVRLRSRSGAAGAHLRYLQRDGTTRDGERGQLYGPNRDQEDGRAFVERGMDDRHCFRFIVAPEDSDRLDDLRGFTRDVMRQMVEDLGTRLDWVAVDHFNTGHPHSHVVIRGRDDQGKDLIIAQDYITDGLRLRAQERVTLELRPERDDELRAKLQAEVGAERFTRIDRAMLAEAREGVLDLRPEAGQVTADFDQTLRVGRAQTLTRLGLAREAEPGVWTLSERLEPTLRELGQRGDIIKAMNQALGARGQDRPAASYAIHGPAPAEPIVGRVIGKGLADELGDRVGIVIDGVDGRVHHVEAGEAEAAEMRIGALVEAGPRVSSRPADRAIAAIAGDGAIYRPSEHRQQVEDGSIRLPPEADPDAFVDSHVRRLEALRRAGIVERFGPDHWQIPPDFEQRAQAYDAERSRQANLRLLSAYDLGRQITSDGATWLDRQLVSRDRMPLASTGFGAEVQQAMDARKAELVRQGHARRTAEGGVIARRDLLPALQRQEVTRVGTRLAADTGRIFVPVEDGQAVRGRLVGATQLASGRFAMIDDGLGFSMVPWRPILEKEIGREVAGVARGDDVSWQLGRKRTLGIGV